MITKLEFSAGGIVTRNENEKQMILVAKHSRHHGWIFPKGHIDQEKNESKEEAALREVKEETGITGEIVEALEPVTYWFVQDSAKIKKTVYYYLMNYHTGDTTTRDQEMEQVEWLPTNEVAERLTYPSDKKVWQEAKARL